LKNVGVRHCALNWNDANALMADDDLVPPFYIEKLHRVCSASISIQGNRAIHHGWTHFNLFAVESNKSLLIRGHVKISRKNSVRRSVGQAGVRALGNFRPVLPQSQNQFIERFACFG
jgi:hypothetical protein